MEFFKLVIKVTGKSKPTNKNEDFGETEVEGFKNYVSTIG